MAAASRRSPWAEPHLWKVWKDRRFVERDDRVPRLVAGLLQVRAGDAVRRLCHHPVVGVLAHGALEVILVKARDVSRHVACVERHETGKRGEQ